MGIHLANSVASKSNTFPPQPVWLWGRLDEQSADTPLCVGVERRLASPPPIQSRGIPRMVGFARPAWLTAQFVIEMANHQTLIAALGQLMQKRNGIATTGDTNQIFLGCRELPENLES